METTTNKIAKLIKQLHKQTVEGKIAWQKTLDDGVFQAGFPNYTLKLLRRRNESDWTEFDYLIRILDTEGEIIEEVADTELDTAELDRVDAFNMMKELYAVARRISMGVDKALDSILSELSD